MLNACNLIQFSITKPAIFQKLIEYLVSMAKRRKLKSGLYCLYDGIYKTQVLFQKAQFILGANIV